MNVLHRHPGLGGAGGLNPEAVRLTCLGVVLAPLVMRDRWSRIAAKPVSVGRLLGRTGQRALLLIGILVLIGAVTERLGSVPATWMLAWFAGMGATAMGGRLLFLRALRLTVDRGLVCDRVALLGTGQLADHLHAALMRARGRGIRLVRVYKDGIDGAADALDRVLAELVEMGRRRELDRVVLALPPTSEDRMVEIAHRLKVLEIEVSACSPLLRRFEGQLQTTHIAGVPLVVLTGRPHYRWGIVAKEVEDRLLSAVLLLGMAPVLALVALAVRLDSPGPVLFRQRRHGCNGSEFEVLKFRTMRWQGDAAGSGAVQTRRGDRRVTRVGAFLRQTSLDELPQLLNVLNGTMSLVGPRPHPVVMRTEERLGDEIIAEYAHRHRVKPGITGWAQINGYRGATETAEQVRRRVEHDIYYIDNWSLLFDLRILLLTPLKVLFQRGNAF